MSTYPKTALLAFILALGATAPAHADADDAYAPRRKTRRSVANLPAKVTTETSTREIPVEQEQTGTGFALFLGAGGGYLSVSPSDPTLEPSKRGKAWLGRAVFAFHNEKVVLDAGLGYLNSKIAGSSSSLSESGRTTRLTDAEVMTRAGLAEFSPRLRLGNTWDLGPVASVLLGTNSSFGVDGPGASSPVFLGLRSGWTFGSDKLPVRLIAQASTSLTIPERTALFGSLGLEIGIPLIRGKTVIREKETQVVRDNFERETVETETTLIEKVDVIKEVVLFTFDDQIIHFEFDRAELRPESREFLSRLGAYLAREPKLWGKLRIEGHTDSRGTPEYNQRLSEARAASIVRALAAGGVPADKLLSRGFGKTRPLDPEDSDVARARNRRVELTFSDVASPRKLRDDVNRIRFATVQPSTCSGGKCL